MTDGLPIGSPSVVALTMFISGLAANGVRRAAPRCPVLPRADAPAVP